MQCPVRFYKIPQYQQRSKPFDNVSEEEGRLRFDLDKNRHPENYIQNEFELIKNYEVVVVVDRATGLMWQQGGSAYPIQYHEALEYVERLNSSQFADFSGWRLPTIDELTSLLTQNKQTNETNDLYIDWIFDSKQEWCWSSDMGSSELAWYVDFDSGSVDVSSFDDPGYVRLVRAGQWQRMLSSKSEFLYSANTPVPDLKRDGFETVEEFQKRITDYKPVPVLAGSAELIKDKYDINTGIFPVKISWKKWAGTFVNKSKKTHIIAERDLARSIYESGHEHPVYAFVGVDGEKAVVSKIDLYALNQPFKIEMSIKYPRRSKPFDSVSNEEVQSHFNLDDNWRPKKYVQNEFELIKDGKVVIDHATGLMWQQGGSTESMKYPDALKYVKRLNSSRFAGFKGWRIPTIDELTSLITETENKQTDDLYIDPIFDSNQRWCWSSDKRTHAGVWFVYFFNYGRVRWRSLGYPRYVRLVRAGQLQRTLSSATSNVKHAKKNSSNKSEIEASICYKNPKYLRRSEPFDSISYKEAQSRFHLQDRNPKKYIKNEFELIKDRKIVIDHATGLMWQQSGSANNMLYRDALKYVTRLNSSKLADYNDWRLPTIDELTSLITENAQINGLYIDPIFDNNQRWCWSSDKHSAKFAWYVYFPNGKVFRSSYFLLYNFNYVRVVRAGQ
ncbi:DUF1566 domain-containing protein [Desulfococcaceae bacterium HSG7]|nr:DUF1566 domain-containing protein [Desulfococcaceae bacterium HSG7]